MRRTSFSYVLCYDETWLRMIRVKTRVISKRRMKGPHSMAARVRFRGFSLPSMVSSMVMSRAASRTMPRADE